WVSGYYPGWVQNTGSEYLPPDAVDYSAVTHIMHFALWPTADGSLDSTSSCHDPNCVGGTHSTSIIQATHAAGKQVLIVVGGGGSDIAVLFRQATAPGVLPTFLHNIKLFVD